MLLENCTLTTTLAPYAPDPTMPWDARRVKHLYRRLGFGASKSMIDQALLKHPQQVVDQLLDDAVNAAPAAQPAWADWPLSRYDDFAVEQQQQVLEWALVWLNDMLANPARGRMTLFWHNHFVTKLESYACPSWMYSYYKVLERHAFGDFRQFVREMGKTPAMLVFLNGVQNTRFSPNENYARELYELFTLGRDNGYTQQDIRETARALTGWNGFTEACAPIDFVSLLHDPGVKQIFGQTGTYTYDSLHDLLFTQRRQEVARHICGKIYRHFVSPEPDESLIDQLALSLSANNFSLLPVFRLLFRSERFFDDKVIGTIVKSPLDYLLQFVKESELPVNNEISTLLLYQAAELGQLIFNPVDVAGWPGDKSWIDTSKLTGRWLTLEAYVYWVFNQYPEALSDLAARLGVSHDDPAVISRAIFDHFLPAGLQHETSYTRATDVFKWEVPQNYYDTGSWNLDWVTVPAQTGLLLQHLIRTPEFQLT